MVFWTWTLKFSLASPGKLWVWEEQVWEGEGEEHMYNLYVGILHYYIKVQLVPGMW